MKIEDYKKLIKNLDDNSGKTDVKFRKKMAYKVFNQTSRYDKIIAKWFNDKNNKKIKLRYGENPNQKAFLYSRSKKSILIIKLVVKK